MTFTELKILQALPLEDKIRKSTLRIREWYEHWCGQVCVSFSGGKDSTVLLHLVRAIYPDVPAAYVDTGLEYPEIREFVLEHENVTVMRPKMNFRQVLDKYGYPVISKETAQFVYNIRTTKSERMKSLRLNGKILADGRRGRLGMLSERWKFLIDAPFKISDKCCDVMKKAPLKIYEKTTGQRMMTGEMAAEGRRRKSNYLMRGCNAFEMQRPKSTPLGFWTEQDILHYIRKFQIPYSKAYGKIVEAENGTLRTTECSRTGCMFCMFGLHLEKGENRFMRMQRTHPEFWNYCVHTLEIGKVLDYIGIPYTPGGTTKINPFQEVQRDEICLR